MWRLRKLTLVDFKSFEGCHVFGPLDAYQFSCVVGLNGSGKSNIVDALAFVLGSGSRNLRSNRFAELCHKDRVSGKASGRKARVKVTFAEDGASELAFERVVTSDSSTSFYLNGKAADRKAYNKALMEIGAYGKSCIVAQGFIESISLSTALEKGQLLDNLSGSAAYKEEYDQKNKSVHDLTAELKAIGSRKDDAEQSVRNMKKQYAEFQKYQEIKERSRKAKALLAAVTTRHIQWQGDELQKRISDIQSQIAEYELEIKKQRQQTQTDASAQRLCVENVRKLRKELQDITQSRSDRESEKAAMESKMNELKMKIKLAEERYEQCCKEREDVKRDYKECVDKINKRRSSIEAKLRANRFLSLDASERDRVTKLAAKAGGELRLAEVNQAIKDASLQLQKSDDRIATLLNRKPECEEKLSATVLKREEIERISSQLSRDLSAYESTIENERKLLLELTILENQIKALRDLLYGHNDGGERNSHVCPFLEKHRKVYGRLGDLITITNPLHITAIGAALGKQRESIVVETYEDAVECIKLLKQKHWGVEEFIPLAVVRTGKDLIPQKLRQHPDLFRPAIDCVSSKIPEIMTAAGTVLGDTVIVDGDIDRARQLAFREWTGSLKIVTTDGQRIAKNGNITLGSRGAGSANMNRAKNETKLAELEKEFARLKELQCKEYGPSVMMETRTSLEQAKEQIRTNNSTGMLLLSQEAELRSAIDRMNSDLEDQKRKANALTDELARLNQERLSTAQSIQTCSGKDADKIKSLQEARELEDELTQVNDEELKELKNRSRNFGLFLSQIGVEEATEMLGGDYRSNVIELSKRIEAWIKQKPKIKSAQETISAYSQEVKEMQQVMALRDSADEQKDRYQQVTEELERVEKELARIRSASGSVNDRLRRLMNKKNSSERERYELELKLKDLEKAIIVQTEEEVIVEETLESERDFAKAIERVSREVAECEAELQGMVVNHDAERMLDHLKQRLSEVTDDFERKRSEKHLVDLDLMELRETRKSLFMKCFNAVNKSLDDIYVQLTGAGSFGTAQIELEDEVSPEPFNKGVIFHAIPPGKRYTDMDSLSGGEKAMAALSLLFACQKFKRSPFIVLDEVDAPLDLENLTSLRDYLRNCPFQVFMITLKEEVYAAADAIIGVYKSPVDHNSQTLTVSLQEFPLNNKQQPLISS